MFKVGERRNPLKALPGIVRLSVLRAESMDYYQQAEALDKYRFSYCIVKFLGHDPVKTAICEKQTKPASEDNKGDVQHVIEWRHDDEELNVELDAPHSDYDQPIVIEMYDATEHSKVRYETAVQFSTGADAVPITSLVDEEDVKVGTVLIPLPWIVNGFGGGYCVAQDEPGLFRFYVQGAQRHSFPYELECKIHYKMEAEHSVRAHLRWTSMRLQGSYALDRTRSSNMEEFYQATLVPWAVRKMEESGDEEKLDVKVSKAGKEITITRATNYYKEEPEPMRVDELFQSVKTFRGTMAETRLYWDFSNVSALKKGEAYPSPILMSVTRLGGDIGEVVEAWDMHKEGKTLTQLSMLQKLPTKFKRVYTRISDDERIELPKHPKVVTKAGLLTVVVLEGRDLAPEDSPNLNAYAALKILRFSNKDVHCTDPINKDSVTEQATRAFDSDANPQWNQMFRFPITPIPNFHDVLILQVWNKENAEDEALIGTLRIPVPWAYNGYGMDLGPWTASSFQASFKLKRGDDIDPSAKAKYGGGRVTLRFAYQPTVA